MGKKFYTPAADYGGLSQPAALDPALPNVLIIGDSISIGYTLPVRERLAGIANVCRAPVNCGDTRAGLANLDVWLGEAHWDVIHFNWGLHDLCHRHPDSQAYGNRDKINGKVSVPLADYARNLETLVARLKQTGAVLVFASTTRVPDGEVGRFAGDELQYNAVATDIMCRHAIALDDLHALSASLPPGLWKAPGDVHFTADGYARLGEQVAETVKVALSKRNS